MNVNIVRFLLSVFSLLAVPHLHAQTEQVEPWYDKTHSYQLGGGPVNILDTYLTPEKFSGTGFTLLSMAETRKRNSRWSSLIQHQLHASTASDRADNEAMMEGTYNCLFGRFCSWEMLGGHLQLQAGGLANVGLGVLYNTRSNANNPAQARLSLLLMPSGIATYRFQWLKRNTL